MSFIKRLGAHRIEALKATQVVGGGQQVVGGNAEPLQPGLGPTGGRPAPVKKNPGLSGMMMRRTVGDVFSAGAKLGLSGPLLARHAGSVEQLTQELKALSAKLERLDHLPPGAQSLVRGLPARLIGSMSEGLQRLDPAAAVVVMGKVFELVGKIAEAPVAPSASHLRALESVAIALVALNASDLGPELKPAYDLLRGLKAGSTELETVAETISSVAGPINGTSANKPLLFRAALQAMLAGVQNPGRPAPEITQETVAALGAKLPEGVLQIITNGAQSAINNQNKRAQNAAGQLAAAEQGAANFDAQLAGPNGDKLRTLEGLRQQAVETLPAGALAQWYAQILAAAGGPQEQLQVTANATFEALAKSGGALPNPAALNQVTQLFSALGQVGGVTQKHLLDITKNVVPHVPPAELPGVLTQLRTVLAGLSDGARARVLDADLATLGQSFVGRSERYARQGGPMAVLTSTLEAADAATVKETLKNAVRFAAEIPDTENGPIVQLLRNALPADMAAVARSGLDPAVVAASHPTLPKDSIPHLIGLAQEGGHDVGKWIVDLEAYFKAARGNKNHARNLRTLVASSKAAGTDPVALVGALVKAKLAPQILSRTVEAMLNESNFAPTKEYLDNAVAALGRGDNLLQQIEGRVHTQMMKQLNFEQLLGDANVRITQHGLDAIKGPLATFFRDGAGKPQVDQALLKTLMVAVLEDRFDGFRFTTPATEAHLSALNGAQKRLWLEPQTMMHVRFEGEGKARFEERVSDASKLGGLLLGRMEEAWGKLDALRAKHTQLVDQLRNIDKNDRDARLPVVRELRGLPGKIAMLEWATQLGNMSPATATPEKFLALGGKLQGVHRALGPSVDEVMHRLTWLLRLSDISYSEVVTNDGPDLPTMYKLSTTNCLRWPGDGGEVMGYAIDPNKRMIVTKNQAGEMRRAVLRLVERQDEGHKGQPMLLLERTYPDTVTQEEKQRLIEHTIRRAAEMGIAAGFATEYYWDASKTGRRQIVDMNAVLEDLCKRYDTTVEKKIMSVLNRGSNCQTEYHDSGPPNGAAGRGQVGVRRHNGKTDRVFENEFVVLQPK